MKFCPSGLLRIRRCILALDCSFDHRYISGDRITSWNARVLNFRGCLELKVAVGGGVTMHGDRSIRCGPFCGNWCTARVCAANVNGVVIGEDDLRESTFQWPTDGAVVLNVDVDSLVYRDPVSRCNILLVVGSPSCQPWSRGSHALGFGHKFGLHVISFLGVVTFFADQQRQICRNLWSDGQPGV